MRFVGRRIALFLVLFLLTGCAAPGGPNSATPAAPIVQHISADPELEAQILEWARSYSLEAGPLGFDLEIMPPSAGRAAATAGEVDLWITAQDKPADWFATPLLNTAISFIVHPENPIDRFEIKDLERIFSGSARLWSEFEDANQGLIVVVVSIEGDAVRNVVEEQILKSFSYTAEARIAGHAAGVIELVSTEPGAIGVIPTFALDDRVRAVPVPGWQFENTLPGIDSSPGVLRIIATAPDEPQGSVREFLSWVQEILPGS
jgi:hypothetical protein